MLMALVTALLPAEAEQTSGCFLESWCWFQSVVVALHVAVCSLSIAEDSVNCVQGKLCL